MEKLKLLDKAWKQDAIPKGDFPYNSPAAFLGVTILADCLRFFTLYPVSPRQQVFDSHFGRCYHLEIDFEVVDMRLLGKETEHGNLYPAFELYRSRNP